MNSKHILLYTDDPGLGGVAQYNHSILLALVARGYRVGVVQSQSDSPLVVQQRQVGIQHIFLDFDTSQEFGRTLTCLEDAEVIFTKNQIDLIIFSDCCPLSNFAAKQVAIASNIPFIVVVGFVAPYLAERFSSYLDHLSQQYAQAKEVIAVSQENLDLLHQLFQLPKHQGQVIHYGRPEQYFAPRNLEVRDRFRHELGIPADAIVCFTAARLESVKGFEYQLGAMVKLHETSSWEKFYFVWAGDGSLKEDLASALEELEIGDRVKLIGQRWDIADWYDAADIFVLPSQMEGMPLAIMEAMAKGIPVIASAVSGIPEELGDTGKLLPNPKIDSQATVDELAHTIHKWAEDLDLLKAVGLAGQQRAKQMFTEALMIQQTTNVIERALLPNKDYVSPGLAIVRPDAAFPHMIVGNPDTCQWQYLRREVPHNWYVDERQQLVGFLSRDEAHILYNTALQFKGKKALEIGCWLGWSACHLALAGVELDVIDPVLGQPEFYESVSESLRNAGVLNSVNLVSGFSPQKVEELASQKQCKWSLIFIDGNHDEPGPLEDAIACEKLAEPDALIIFHDLSSPEVAQGLDYFKEKGWNTLVYQTMQIMGVAWRGNVEPIQHQPDPSVSWSLPSHLQAYDISNDQPRSVVPNWMEAIDCPMVSVVIPCYNQAKYLQETVNSVLSQPYKNWEIIIVNDGSTDNTTEVSQALITAHSDCKIQLIEKINGGPADARNAGIAVAKGEYILPLDGDDKLADNAIAQLLKQCLKHGKNQPCVAFGSYQMFGLVQQTVRSLNLYSSDRLKQHNMLHPTSMYPKSVWEAIQGYKLGIDSYEDWEFWLNCQAHSIPFIGIQEIVVHYRKLPGSMLERAKHLQDQLYAKIVCHHPTMFDDEQIDRAKATLYLIDFPLIGIESLHQLELIIEQYQKDSCAEATEQLGHFRKHIFEYLLNTPLEKIQGEYTAGLGYIHRLLRNSGLQYQPAPKTEQETVSTIVQTIAQSSSELLPMYVLGAMLYCLPYQLEWKYNLEQIPEWLIEDYFQFMMQSPSLFMQAGESDRYHAYMDQWVSYLHDRIMGNRDSLFWQQVALSFTQSANFIFLYFNEFNLRDLYRKRAEIMSTALMIQDYELNYDFLKRSPQRKKIRLGILAAHFFPQTETFSTLPAYKHLNRDDFEIILFSEVLSHHRLENYCAGHADQFVVLPNLLQDQVKTIRDTDLDIILIATNVTAVTNGVTNLALHRLARIQMVNNSSCVTTGMKHVDYYISGALTESDNAQEHYTETLLTLEGAAHCYDFATEENVRPTTIISRETLGIGSDAIIYISGANFYKITPEVENAWVKILSQVPNSRLVLYPFNPNWSSSYPKIAFQTRLQTTLSRYGLADDRLILLDVAPTYADARERLNIADIYLDSYPFSGVTSLLDPLIMGLPPVVMSGQAFRSRMGAALLQELHLPGLIAENETQYIEMAIALAQQPELRQQRRGQIAQAMQNNPRFLDSRYHSAQMATIFQNAFHEYESKTIQQEFRLRSINLIAFPDWEQPEAVLFQSLVDLMRSIVTHGDRHKMTLLIHTGDFDESEADMAISSVFMYLMTEEGLEIEDESVAIVLVNPDEAQWEALIPHLSNWVAFSGEENASTPDVSALPSCDLADLQTGVFVG